MEESLFRTTLEDIPALLRWVDASERTGCMSGPTARAWRARIEAWRDWLERAAATTPSGRSRPRA